MSSLHNHLSGYSESYYDGDLDEWWERVRGTWKLEINRYPVEKLGDLDHIWINSYEPDVTELEKRFINKTKTS